MLPARLASPIVGAFANTDDGQSLLTPEALFPHVARWTVEPDPDEWFIDPRGVALFRPSGLFASPSGSMSGIALRGNLRVPSNISADGTEPLSAALHNEPEAVIRACRGDFLVAHVSGTDGRLILARNHLGTRSFYLRRVGPLTVFASEPDALTGTIGDAPIEADRRSLFWFLAFGGPEPGRTLVRNVRQVPAAHLVQVVPGMPPVIRRYWTPLDANASKEASPAVLDRIEQTLLRATLSELPIDRPFALGLSGGVDSSLLLAHMQAQEAPPVCAVNVRFESGQDANEDGYARFAADRFGVPLEIVRVSADQALDLLDNVVGLLPEPCAAWAALSHAAVLGRLRECGIDHLVSGFGSDEIFGGYDHFRIAAGNAIRAARRAGFSDPRGLYDDLGMNQRPREISWLFPGVARFFSDAALRQHLRQPWRRWSCSATQVAFYREAVAMKPEAEPIELFVAHECQHRIPDIVLKSFEPVGRRFGVSSGYPFLDPEMCRLAAGLRLEDRYRTAAGAFSLTRTRLLPQYKWALMQLALRHLPKPLLERQRMSYTAPFAIWMRDPRFARYVNERIDGSRLWDLGMLERSAYEEARNNLEAGPGPMAHRLWILLVLAMWCDRYAAH